MKLNKHDETQACVCATHTRACFCKSMKACKNDMQQTVTQLKVTPIELILLEARLLSNLFCRQSDGETFISRIHYSLLKGEC